MAIVHKPDVHSGAYAAPGDDERWNWPVDPVWGHSGHSELEHRAMPVGSLSMEAVHIGQQVTRREVQARIIMAGGQGAAARLNSARMLFEKLWGQRFQNKDSAFELAIKS